MKTLLGLVVAIGFVFLLCFVLFKEAQAHEWPPVESTIGHFPHHITVDRAILVIGGDVFRLEATTICLHEAPELGVE